MNNQNKLNKHQKIENEPLIHHIIRNKNWASEQFSIDRIKINRLENDTEELKFCVYSLMFLNVILLIILAVP